MSEKKEHESHHEKQHESHHEKQHGSHHEKQHAHSVKKSEGMDTNKIMLGVAGVIIVLVLAFVALGMMGKNTPPVVPAPAVPTVTIYKISAPGCTQCKSYDAQVAQIKTSAAGVAFTEKSLDGTTKEAKDIAAQYGVTRAPAVIMTGAVDKVSAPLGWTSKNGAITSPVMAPPYISIATGKVAGLVNSVIVNTPACTQCTDLTQFTTALKQNGVILANEKVIDSTTQEGKTYIAKYGAKTTPFLVLSEGFGAYDTLAAEWSNVGSMVGNEYLMDIKLPPYYDLEGEKVRGLVSMTLIADKVCTDCSDLSVYKNIFEQTGIKIDQYSALDISDTGASDLAKKYNVNKLPTFILTGDIEAYGPEFIKSIQTGGTIDLGAFVFRNYTVIPDAKFVEYKPNSSMPVNKSATVGLTILPR